MTQDTPTEISTAAADLIKKSGLKAGFTAARLHGGGNSRAFKISDGAQSVLLKEYFRHPGDTRDRLTSDYSFCNFAWSNGVRQVPQPICMDTKAGLALYEFIEGRPLTASDLNLEKIGSSSEFVIQLNRHRNHALAAGLPDAAESCFGFAAHLDLLSLRLERLKSISGSDETTKLADVFVKSELMPAATKMISRCKNELQLNQRLLGGSLSDSEKILSPSDFGFHNALLSANGKVRYFDFEYAGWDDPAKLVCDYFCQQAVPVSIEFRHKFCQDISELLNEAARKRVQLLFPIYQLKWCCILLNEFLPAGERRRSFAQPDVAMDDRKRGQLEKVRRLFGKISETDFWG